MHMPTLTGNQSNYMMSPPYTVGGETYYASPCNGVDFIIMDNNMLVDVSKTLISVNPTFYSK